MQPSETQAGNRVTLVPLQMVKWKEVKMRRAENALDQNAIASRWEVVEQPLDAFPPALAGVVGPHCIPGASARIAA